MADIWPIENVWGYIKEKIGKHEIENLPALKDKIVQLWNTINPAMYSRLINSIPKRLQCLINKKGYPIHKADYNGCYIKNGVVFIFSFSPLPLHSQNSSFYEKILHSFLYEMVYTRSS